MSVGSRGGVIGNATFVGLGHPVGRQPPFVQLRGDIVGSRSTQGIVDTNCSGRTIGRSRDFNFQTVFLCHPCQFVEIDQLGGVCQVRRAEFEEKEDGSTDAFPSGLHPNGIVCQSAVGKILELSCSETRHAIRQCCRLSARPFPFGACPSNGDFPFQCLFFNLARRGFSPL